MKLYKCILEAGHIFFKVMALHGLKARQQGFNLSCQMFVYCHSTYCLPMEKNRTEQNRIDWFLVVNTQYRHSVYNSRSSSSLFNKQPDNLMYCCSSPQSVNIALLSLSIFGEHYFFHSRYTLLSTSSALMQKFGPIKTLDFRFWTEKIWKSWTQNLIYYKNTWRIF